MLQAVIHARGRYVRVTYPVLNFFEICVVLKRVGNGDGAQRMRAEAIDIDADHICVHGQHLVDAGWCDRTTGVTDVVADGVEQRRRLVVTVASRLKIGGDRAGGRRIPSNARIAMVPPLLPLWPARAYPLPQCSNEG